MAEDALKKRYWDSIVKYNEINPQLASYYRHVSDSTFLNSTWLAPEIMPIYDSTGKLIKADSLVWPSDISDSIAAGSRFGNLKMGESVDIYSMRPIFLFYDSCWSYPWEFDGGRKLYRYRCGPNEMDQECCSIRLYRRMCSIYDIDTADMRKLVVPHNQFYWFLRRLTITKQICNYKIDFYKDKFFKPEDTAGFMGYKRIWFNKNGNLNWELERSTIATLAVWLETHGTYRSDQIQGHYGAFLCKLDKAKVSKRMQKNIGVNEGLLDEPFTPGMYKLYQTHWMVLDYHDSNVFKIRMGGDYGDIIGLYKPWQASYWKWTLPIEGPSCTYEPGKNGMQDRRNEKKHWTAMQLMARQSMIGMLMGY